MPRTRVILVRSALLLATAVALWGLCAWPAWQLAGAAGLEGLTLAAVLCSLPGFVVFVLTSGVEPGSPRGAAMVMVGTGIRLAVVMAGALGVRWLAPHLKWREFHVWLLVFYLATLGLETVLVLRKPRVEKPEID